MVARQTLTLFVWVQILVPQPTKTPRIIAVKSEFEGFLYAVFKSLNWHITANNGVLMSYLMSYPLF